MGSDYWTPAAVAYLRELYNGSGANLDDIAAMVADRFGPTTPNAVWSKADRLGISYQRTKRLAPVSIVQRVVADAYGITVPEMKFRSLSRRISEPRHVAMALGYEMSGLSYHALAKAFCRSDHTTILHGISRAREKYPEAVERMRAAVMDAVANGYTPPPPPPEEALPVLVEEPAPVVEPRAEKFEPRKVRPARIIQTQARAENVTGALMGDPGHKSLRVARGEVSRCDG